MNKNLNTEQKIVIFLPLIIGFLLVPFIETLVDLADSGKISSNGVFHYFKTYSGIFSWYQLLPFLVFTHYLSVVVTYSTKKRAYIILILGSLTILPFYLSADILITINSSDAYSIPIWHIIRPVIAIPILYISLFVFNARFKN